jgi:hypothetical protein
MIVALLWQVYIREETRATLRIMERPTVTTRLLFRLAENLAFRRQCRNPSNRRRTVPSDAEYGRTHSRNTSRLRRNICHSPSICARDGQASPEISLPRLTPAYAYDLPVSHVQENSRVPSTPRSSPYNRPNISGKFLIESITRSGLTEDASA